MDRKLIKPGAIAPLDAHHVMTKIESSFNIKLDREVLQEATTVKKLSDVIINKINNEGSDICSTQHAFYLLRNAIASATRVDKCSITPNTQLAKLFPKETRIQSIKGIEEDLGFEVDLLQPKRGIVILFSILLAVSFTGLFYSWIIGAAGILVSIAALKLAGKFGKEMHLKTVGELANKLSRETRLKAKRENVANRNEIEQKVTEIFSSDLNLQPVVLRRTANG
jgi:hypothetical protein